MTQECKHPRVQKWYYSSLKTVWARFVCLDCHEASEVEVGECITPERFKRSDICTAR